ncbi:amino acid permease, partial [Photobacterium damselae]
TIGTLALLTFIGNMVSWTMGASRAAAEAASEGELPDYVGKMSPKFNTPIGANFITGMLSTLVIIAYAVFAQSSDDLFWSVFAFSSCVFLLPYLFMFPAYLKLRMSEPDVIRPFKVPGNNTVQWLMSIVCFFVIAQSVVLFIFPEIFSGEIVWSYTAPVLLGVLLTITIGEYILHLAIIKKSQNCDSSTISTH